MTGVLKLVVKAAETANLKHVLNGVSTYFLIDDKKSKYLLHHCDRAGWKAESNHKVSHGLLSTSLGRRLRDDSMKVKRRVHCPLPSHSTLGGHIQCKKHMLISAVWK